MSKSKKGILLPPAVGYSFHVWIKLLQLGHISPKYYFRVLIISLINLVNFPFRTYERLFINKRIQKKAVEHPPIFILGHWRSGTTHLHNLLCQDQQMAYTTTYQSVFPDTIFNTLGRFLFQGFSKLLMPTKREGDNVTLGSELPQEEEFALANKTPMSFYFYWMLPKQMLNFYQSYIRFKDVDKKQLNHWKEDYQLLIKKAIKNTQKEIYLSKNPPNTGRIKTLLEMYPNAKFIHIHRNPVEVFLSTRNFYYKMMPHLQLQNISKHEIDELIVKVYKLIMNDYLMQKKYIPKGNLIEVAFSDIEEHPLATIKSIYDTLELPKFEVAAPNFKLYLNQTKHYKKNKHSIHKKDFDTIAKEWKFAFDNWNYKTSENIQILP